MYGRGSSTSGAYQCVPWNKKELQVTYIRAPSESTGFFSRVETPVSPYIYFPALTQAQWLWCCYRVVVCCSQNLGAAVQTSRAKKNPKLLFPIFKNCIAATSWAKVGHTLWFWTRLDVIKTSCCSLSVQVTSFHLSHWNRTLRMFMVLCWYEGALWPQKGVLAVLMHPQGWGRHS